MLIINSLCKRTSHSQESISLFTGNHTSHLGKLLPPNLGNLTYYTSQFGKPHSHSGKLLPPIWGNYSSFFLPFRETLTSQLGNSYIINH